MPTHVIASTLTSLARSGVHHAFVAYPLMGSGGDLGGPVGYTYAAVLVRTDGMPSGRPCSQDDVLAALRELRFTGWLAHPEDGWLVAVPARAGGTVAAGRRGVVDVGAELAVRLGAPAVAVRVLDDRQLLLAGWVKGEEVGRYVSDPSYGLGPDDDILPAPLGVERAEALAAAAGRPDAGVELAELLAEELDEDSVIESERLAGVLRLLGLPRWLVSAASLPRDIPLGPSARSLTRLGAGVPGVAGRLRGRAAEVVRRRRLPPSPVPEAPRGGPAMEPWMF